MMRTDAQREHLACLAAEVMRLGLRRDISPADFVAVAAAIRACLDDAAAAPCEEASDAA